MNEMKLGDLDAEKLASAIPGIVGHASASAENKAEELPSPVREGKQLDEHFNPTWATDALPKTVTLGSNRTKSKKEKTPVPLGQDIRDVIKQTPAPTPPKRVKVPAFNAPKLKLSLQPKGRKHREEEEEARSAEEDDTPVTPPPVPRARKGRSAPPARRMVEAEASCGSSDESSFEPDAEEEDHDEDDVAVCSLEGEDEEEEDEDVEEQDSVVRRNSRAKASRVEEEEEDEPAPRKHSKAKLPKATRTEKEDQPRTTRKHEKTAESKPRHAMPLKRSRRDEEDEDAVHCDDEEDTDSVAPEQRIRPSKRPKIATSISGRALASAATGVMKQALSGAASAKKKSGKAKSSAPKSLAFHIGPLDEFVKIPASLEPSVLFHFTRWAQQVREPEGLLRSSHISEYFQCKAKAVRDSCTDVLSELFGFDWLKNRLEHVSDGAKKTLIKHLQNLLHFCTCFGADAELAIGGLAANISDAIEGVDKRVMVTGKDLNLIAEAYGDAFVKRVLQLLQVLVEHDGARMLKSARRQMEAISSKIKGV